MSDTNEGKKMEREQDSANADVQHSITEQRNDGGAPDTAPADANHPSAIGSDEEVARMMHSKSRRSFLALGVGAVGTVAAWKWLNSRAEIEGIPYPLRRAHEFNEKLTEGYFAETRLAPTFERAMAVEPRVNGEEGLSEKLDPQSWRLAVLGLAAPTKYPQYVKDVNYEFEPDDSDAPGDSADDSGDEYDDTDDGDDAGSANDNQNNKDAKSGSGSKDSKSGSNVGQQKSAASTSDNSSAEDVPEPGLLLTLADIKRLPRVEMTTQLKCIEGWSVIVNWAGARLSDFMQEYQPLTRNNSSPDARNRPQDLVRYVSLETPDGEYYVGMDMASALHPQTLLCYEMNGQPLTAQHGAPLRLVTPVKYGIKHIKRIGRIAFSNERPKDYWAERGYDWYSGH